MMDGAIAPFDGAPGVWLRCQLHAHTTESDGWLSPAMLRRYHVEAGYDVLAITDHDVVTSQPAGNDQLIVLSGVELTVGRSRIGGAIHLLGLGVTTMPAVEPGSSVSAAAAAIRAAGGLSFLAHPVWSGIWPDEIVGLESINGIEIYNGGIVREQGRGYGDTHWDFWLCYGHRLTGIACDDLHRAGYESFFGWTMIHARERSREAVLAALAEGRFYSTTGPRILMLCSDRDRLMIRTSPAKAIFAVSNPPYGAGVLAERHGLTFHATRFRTNDGQMPEGLTDGDWLTGAIFPIRLGVRYMRFVVVDTNGCQAWTNPVWIEDSK